MKNILELIKKHKVRLLIILTVFFFFRSCSRSIKVGNLEKQIVKYTDTLSVVKVKSYGEGVKFGVDKEKELILDFMDDELRSPQNLNVRVKFEELHNNIDSNKHRK
jgi:hypothetical protein